MNQGIAAECVITFEQGGPHDLPYPIDGYYFLEGRELFLPWMATRYAGAEGHGHVGRLLDAAKEAADVVIVPTVLSPRLVGMLVRRGFVPEDRWFDDAKGNVECMTWRRADLTDGKTSEEEK